MVFNSIKYDDKELCIKCSSPNHVSVIDHDEGFISECETMCSICNHKDYWAYGFFQSKSEQLGNNK